MEILSLKTIPQSQIISQAVKVLRDGGLLIYSTETVYGLGADATNQQAVNKLLKFKGRRGLKPILIAVSNQKMAEKYVDLNEAARRLYQTFLPGPVAIISKVKTSFAPKQLSKLANLRLRLLPSEATPSTTCNVRAGDGEGANFANEIAGAKLLAAGIASPESTVGIRIPDYPLTLKIIKAFGKPITSTSANISGAKNPWSIRDILETTPNQKLEMIDLIIDAGQLPKHPPSTVIDTTHEETEIVRQGETNVNLMLNDELRITNVKTIVSSSEKQTRLVARNLISGVLFRSPFTVHRSPLVLALQGPLGAGKTVFAKGIAAALGVTSPIRSPSYTLVKEYPIPREACATCGTCDTCGTFFHVDAWRLSDPQEFADLDLENILRPGNIIIIEWIDRLAPILDELKQKAKIVLVQIEILNQNKRSIKITR